MPPKSQSQRRWAYATAEGKTDAPPSVGREFLGHGVTRLPERVKAALGTKPKQKKRRTS